MVGFCLCSCHNVAQPSEEWYAEYKDKFWGFIKPNVSYQVLAFIRKIESAAIERERQRMTDEVVDWYTLAPEYRTKERLLAVIKKIKS